MANPSASQLPTGSGLPSVPGSSGKTTTLGDGGKSKRPTMFMQHTPVSAVKPALNPIQANITHQIQNNKPVPHPQLARSIHEQAATSDQLNQQFAKSTMNQQFAKSIHERATTSDQKRECRVRESQQATMRELSQARAELARAREMHMAAETSWRAERAVWEVERAELTRVQDSLYDVNARLRGRERARRAKAESARSPSGSSSPSPSTHADTESLTDW